VILPALPRVRLPYRPVLYAPLALLHVAVAARVIGDLTAIGPVRTLGGVLSELALLLFAGCAIAVARSRAGHDRKAPAVNPLEVRIQKGPQPLTPPRPRASWHLRANAIVLAWLGLTVAVALAGEALPAPRWLLIHVFLLGAVSTAILIWSEHFTVALLRARTPGRRGSLTRLALLNVATVAILYGVAVGPWQLAAAGATMAVGVVLWHAHTLISLVRHALPGRFGHVIGWYVCAAGALAAGGVLGGLLAAQVGNGETHERLHAAHAQVNLLGWIGLTVLGTLFTLWPTVLRTRMSERTRRASRAGLPLVAAGLAVAVAGLVAGWRWIALAGLVAYAAGTLTALVPLAEAARRRRPHTGAAWMLGASVVWFEVALVADLVIVATRPAGEVAAALAPLLPLVLVGFIAQVLLGSLLHLLPAVLGGGPARFKENAALLERGWTARLAALNLGVPLLALPVPTPLGLLGWALVLAAGAAFIMLAVIALTRARTAEGANTRAAEAAKDRILAALPLSFDAGLSQITTAFWAGAAVILMNYLLPRDLKLICAKEMVTGLTAVPPLWFQISELDWSDNVGASLRYFANTGGHMPKPLLQRLRDIFPNAKPYLMYGLTEAFRSTYLDPKEVDRRPGSIGKAIPNAEIMVVNADGKPCAPGEEGELVHRGALVSLGYWNDAERTAQRFRPVPGRAKEIPVQEMAVWSGDIVKTDEEGFIYYVGRRDDMIKTSGYRVSSTEIEEIIFGTGLVEEAVAIGVPHPTLGQGIVVVAKPRSGSLDREGLLAACRRDLPLYMVPALFVELLQLPRNPNGKIDRPALTRELSGSFQPASKPEALPGKGSTCTPR
jgi:hypothetical protein